MSHAESCRLLVAEDEFLIRASLVVMLERAGYVVAGEADNGRQAVEMAQHLRPDVVLMDLAMPVMNGLEATRRIRKDFPGTKVLALTQYDDSEYVVPVIEAGASGFISKMSAFSELATAIQAVYRGESFLSPSAAAALVEECQQKPASESGQDPYQQLTDREREVLKLVVEGHTTREIADMLIVSPKTVEWYKTSLMKKLNIHNRTDLIRFAIRKQIIAL